MMRYEMYVLRPIKIRANLEIGEYRILLPTKAHSVALFFVVFFFIDFFFGASVRRTSKISKKIDPKPPLKLPNLEGVSDSSAS